VKRGGKECRRVGQAVVEGIEVQEGMWQDVQKKVRGRNCSLEGSGAQEWVRIEAALGGLQ